MQFKNYTLFLMISITLFVGCKKDEPDNTKALTGLVLAEVLYNPYQRITPPETDTITIPNTNASYQAGRQYTPKCFGNSGNTEFYFYRKTVSPNNKKLLINFMGGGACWSDNNCFGNNTTTFFNLLNTVPDLFVKIAFQGILDANNSSNPLKDYDVLFIPYCTGDLHIGSRDTTTDYNDPYVAVDPEYSHRGHDNVLSVLKYAQENYSQVTNVVVAGQSAGGYGAILNYPHIRQVFSESAKFPNFNKMDLVADASNGAVINGFFQDIVRDKWGSAINMPDWAVGSSTYLNGTPSIQDYMTRVANTYPSDKIGQYTAAFDATQRWFYNVMGIIDSGTPAYSDSSSYFGPGDAREVSDDPIGGNTPSNCNWAINARTAMTGIANSNYSYYIAPGDIHTITTSDSMYGLTSNGTNFNTWLKGIISSASIPADVDCSLGSGSHPCTDKNYNFNSYNDSLKRATSHESYDANKDLYETCFP